MGVLYARETPQDNFTPVSTMGVGIVSQSQAGLMSVPDKVKLDGIDNLFVPVVLTENSDILSSVESGWTIGSSRADIFFGRIVYLKVSGTKSSALPTDAWSTIATLTPALRPTIRKDFAVIDNTGDTIVHGMITTNGELRVWPLTTMREIMFNANYTIDTE